MGPLNFDFNMKKIKFVRDIIMVCLYFIFLLGILSFPYYLEARKINIETSDLKEIDTPITKVDTLSDWQVFVMALVEVECERNPKAKSNKNAIGPFQITPIYVKEVNRLYSTNFTFEDAWNLDKSLTMFNLMNDHYNPSKDIDKAIKLHNPGAGKWYSDRIKQRMKMIRFSEEVRTKLKD